MLARSEIAQGDDAASQLERRTVDELSFVRFLFFSPSICAFEICPLQFLLVIRDGLHTVPRVSFVSVLFTILFFGTLHPDQYRISRAILAIYRVAFCTFGLWKSVPLANRRRK